MQLPKSLVRGRSSRGRPSPMHVVRSVGRGLVGGFVSTLVMTAFRIPIARSLPPTAEFWAQYVGDGEASDYPLPGFVLHLLYGTVGGCLFTVLYERRPNETEVADEKRGAFLGVAYGLALSVFGIHVVLNRVLRMELRPDERFVFHLSHLVYGLTLGSWVGSRAK
ncbi:DUF6789 family protein [Haladaptatus sp. NG-WS-4]